MVSTSTIRSVVGVIGNVISFGMFLAPVDTMVKIVKKKDVQQFEVIPYITTLLNCIMWVIYGLPQVNPDHILVVTINGIGCGLELIYIAIFFAFSTNWCLTRKKITFGLIGEVLFTAGVLAATFYGFHTTKARTFFMGVLCLIFNLGMYFSPLTVMTKVIKTKSVKYMPFWLSFANFLNGSCWTAYACLGKFDIWMVIPNGLGALSSLVQLALYAYYYKKGDSGDGTLPTNSKEIELEMGQP